VAVEDLRIALEHAEEELKLTELAAAYPMGATVVLLRHTCRLSCLMHWIHGAHLGDGDGGCADGGGGDGGASTVDAATAGRLGALRRGFRQGEVEEFRRRVRLLARAAAGLRARLPDPELPLRWAAWFEEQGDIVGLPENHCARYRSQREQVAAVWANNRRTLLTTEEHIAALDDWCGEFAEDKRFEKDEGDSGREATSQRCSGAACASGVASLLRRLLRRWPRLGGPA